MFYSDPFLDRYGNFAVPGKMVFVNDNGEVVFGVVPGKNVKLCPR